MSPTCNTCALTTQDGMHCSLTSWEIKPFEDSCFRHTRFLTTCEFCNIPIIGKKYLELIKGEYKILCSKCSSEMYTCRLCIKSNKCLFETDPSSVPKTVAKTIRQGNMIMQTEIRNPDREKITCTKCDCWIENECQKECGRCKNYQYSG